MRYPAFVPDVHVANAVQARVLLSVELRPMLDLLMREPRSVSDLAEATGLDLQRVYYQIQKLLKAGVVNARSEQHGKRLIKVYRLLQPWFIPYDVTTAETLEPFVSAQVQPRIDTLIGEILRVYVGQTGEQRGFWLSGDGLSLGDTSGAAQHLWEGDEDLMFTIGQISLPPEKVREFKRYLIALTQQEDSVSQKQKQLYAFAVMVVPRKPG